MISSDLEQRPGPHDDSQAFIDWRSSVVETGVLPVVAVLGSRGKTTVVRLLDAIFTAAGLRTATKTDIAVEIRGERQSGELAPWSRALDELARGSLDVGIEEIDWLTTHAIGLERESFPIVVVTNVCGNRDACLVQGDARRAISSLPGVFEAAQRDGMVVINGDDLDVSTEELHHDRTSIFVGASAESPAMGAHLEGGGIAAWCEQSQLFVGSRASGEVVGNAQEIGITVGGRAGFQMHNVLTAAAVATAAGIPAATIAAALTQFTPNSDRMPGSFQLIDVDGITVVVDRPNPSWFLRAVLRTVRDVHPHRVIAVAGRLPGVPTTDLPEVGRLLGRLSSLFVLHSESDDPQRSAALKQGAAQTEFPPVILHTRNENRALSRALALARKGDLLLLLVDHPLQAQRALLRLRQFGPRVIAAAT